MEQPVSNPPAGRTRWVRRMHLYLSCFFAPLLIFFIATGWYQTFQVKRKKLEGESGGWIEKFLSVHKEQVYANDGMRDPTLFKYLVVGMCVSLLVTIGLGIYLAFRSAKKPWQVWVVLLLGLGLPILFLRLGHMMRP